MITRCPTCEKLICVCKKTPTVAEHQAKQMITLLKGGASVTEAEETVGVSLTKLRQKGVMGELAKALLQRVEEAGLLAEATQKKLARATLTEAMLQDDDARLKVAAAKAVLDEGRAQVALQVNNNIVYDEQTIRALESLGLQQKEEIE